MACPAAPQLTVSRAAAGAEQQFGKKLATLFSTMRSLSFLGICAAVAAFLVIAPPVLAQNESAIREDLEGRRVRLKIDMPGSQEGVDLRLDLRRPLDYQEYGSRLKRYGAALRKGDTATVTLVKVKKDLIEFQLDGGGYGTFGDDTDTSSSLPFVEKSKRERELEQLVKDEEDARRRAKLREELNDLRDRRERENRRIEAERQRIQERKKDRLADNRLNGGSRFNLRYEGSVPRGLRAEDVIDALADYVTFLRR